MEKWELFNKKLYDYEDIITFKENFEKKIHTILKDVFPKGHIIIEARNLQRIFYDFKIEFDDMKLFCEIKKEKSLLKRYWNKNVSTISQELKALNTSRGRKKQLKYLLILTDSEDSIEKVSLSPIFNNILVINLKMLYELSEVIPIFGDETHNFIENIFREADGVLYDNFVLSLKRLIIERNEPETVLDIDEININNNLLILNLKPIYEKSFTIFSIEEIELIDKFIEVQFPMIERRHLSILPYPIGEFDKELYVEELVEKGFTNSEIFTIENLLPKLGMDIEIKKKKCCKIIIFSAKNSVFKHFIKNYLAERLDRRFFQKTLLDLNIDIEKADNLIRDSDIVMIDFIDQSPSAYYILGLCNKYEKIRPLVIFDEIHVPAYLKNYYITYLKKGKVEEEEILKFIKENC